MLKRPRRNRKMQAIRSMVQETHLRPEDFVIPFFIVEGKDKKEAIPSMPGVYKYSIDMLVKEALVYHEKGIPAIALFPCLSKEDKDESGSKALDPSGLVPRALSTIKKEIPSLCLIADVALDPYTSHGHDGLVNKKKEILNDETVNVLAEASIIYAASGADFVAPSDMMDGRVAAIRKSLDKEGFKECGIISYAAKYASAFYGPFRDTLGSTLTFGDKKTYQMNPANSREALLEAKLDEEEGADALMVKPAGLYLDVISKIKESCHLPVCAYHVSGEYAMIKAAEEKGLLDASRAFYEVLLSIKRAGADFIFSYAAPHILDLL